MLQIRRPARKPQRPRDSRERNNDCPRRGGKSRNLEPRQFPASEKAQRGNLWRALTAAARGGKKKKRAKGELAREMSGGGSKVARAWDIVGGGDVRGVGKRG